MTSRSRRAATMFGALFATAAGACGGPESDGSARLAPSVAVSTVATRAAAPRAAAGEEPPFVTFAPVPWKAQGKPPVEPPDSILLPWRVFVNQEVPRQKRNPPWRSIAARDAVELEMEPGSRFRCIVNPLEVVARADDEEPVLVGWSLTRRIRCSNDGWASFTESRLDVAALADGTMKPVVDHAEMFLREKDGGKTVRETTILMRSDPEPSGKATTGPPKNL